MSDIDLQTTTPSALDATDKAVVRRGSVAPFSMELVDLGAAAALDVGTVAGTVAAGDHGHSTLGIFELFADRAELRPGVNSGAAFQIHGVSATAYLAFGQSTTISYIQALSTGSDSTSLVFRTANAGAEADNMVLSSTGRLRLGTGVFTSGAHVDVQSTTGGLCIPRMTTAQRDAISAPADGNMIYNSTTGTFELREAGAWLPLQSDLGAFDIQRFTPAMGSASLVLETSLPITAIGTATAANGGVTNHHAMTPRTDFLVTVAATNAIAGWRHTGTGARGLRVGKDANAPGGFRKVRTILSPATGVSNATHRGFAGLCDWGNTAPTDVEPSTRTNIIGMGWDAADANIQFMHNDGSGNATKIDLGASFPVPTSDRGAVYELILSSPNSLTQSVSYRVIRYNTADKTIAAEATGTITTDLPTVTTLLGVGGAMSAGGTSSVVGVALMGILVARGY